MHSLKIAQILGATSIFLIHSAGSSAQTIDEIVVTADFRGRAASELPASVSILDSDAIGELAVQHFEELVDAIPNLNWSGDGHRARYFQIRGVGELEQYQGAPNPSVGFLVDDIDFSGIGTIATLFDVQQVEVLRGPQGTRYGANAIAGLIYMQSALPSPDWNGRVQVVAADDDAVSAGLAFGGPLTADHRVTFRFSAHHHESDGFRNNQYLRRDDSNARDETSIRGRLRWLPNDAWQIDLATMYANIDNGYDAFALDNGYTTLSDNPGRDAQESIGASLRAEYAGLGNLTLTSITSMADSDIVFSYDADWGNDNSWAPVSYDYVSRNDRKRSTLSQEFRLAADDWLVGVYAMQLEDDLVSLDQGDYYDPFYDFADGVNNPFDSNYDATNVAVFSEIGQDIGRATRLTFGVRAEQRSTDYMDSMEFRADPSESMSGGELTLSHEHSDAVTSYVSLSKGYKAGGFNLGTLPAGLREYSTEQLWNLETGVKASLFGGRLLTNAAVFVNRRDDQQVRASFQADLGDPTTFRFVTVNVDGETTGFETDLRWRPNDSWAFYTSIGLLNARFGDIDIPTLLNLDGRAQAHAPDHTLSLGGSYEHANGFFTRLDVTAKADFYFDVSHDEKSKSYEVVNARVGYAAETWTAQLWARNLLDESYAVRGFYFGNEPPDFPNTLYTRLGDPRQVGVTFDRSF